MPAQIVPISLAKSPPVPGTRPTATPDVPIALAPSEVTSPATSPLIAPTGVEQMSVRRFFNRMLMAGSEQPGLPEASWETSSVDAFFLRLTERPAQNALNPEKKRSGAEREEVKQAFAGFTWD